MKIRKIISKYFVQFYLAKPTALTFPTSKLIPRELMNPFLNHRVVSTKEGTQAYIPSAIRLVYHVTSSLIRDLISLTVEPSSERL